MPILNRWMYTRRTHRPGDNHERTTNRKNRSRRAFRLVNSPIVITALSGILAAVLTHRWQEDSARRESMQKSMIIFADQYSKVLSIMPERKLREIQLRTLYQDRRKCVESVECAAKLVDVEASEKKWNDILIRVYALPEPRSLTAHVRAVFGSEVIHSKCDELDKLTYDIETTHDFDRALKMNAQAYRAYEQLIVDMSREIRGVQHENGIRLSDITDSVREHVISVRTNNQAPSGKGHRGDRNHIDP